MVLPLEPFDELFMARENAIFPEWLLGKHLQLLLSEAEQQLLDDTFACLTANSLAQPQGVMHRDFHSRNLMVCSEGEGDPVPALSELAIIDFQDMVMGPLSYDLVSLLKDCYVRWPDEVLEQGMQLGYARLSQAGLLGELDYASFRRHADLTGMQRHLKAAGLFTRLYHRDGKSGYLKDIPVLWAMWWTCASCTAPPIRCWPSSESGWCAGFCPVLMAQCWRARAHEGHDTGGRSR